ncbi:hypothetical protein NDU88_000376 [Pleurodeles waltl]|uniref:Uncharacterized protein n=1 Tax=Pleurodeles waltl TaxID=8319 RepID=A0AAV7TF99_PLEWA|nr:hypothetical protein NDU88_000376 [Pleurodeles waltl]
MPRTAVATIKLLAAPAPLLACVAHCIKEGVMRPVRETSRREDLRPVAKGYNANLRGSNADVPPADKTDNNLLLLGRVYFLSEALWRRFPELICTHFEPLNDDRDRRGP